jgi:hypothetical protein
VDTDCGEHLYPGKAMENPSVVVTDVPTAGLTEFLNFTMNDTISRLYEGFTDELAMTELRVTNDPVSLKVNCHRRNLLTWWLLFGIPR